MRAALFDMDRTLVRHSQGDGEPVKRGWRVETW